MKNPLLDERVFARKTPVFVPNPQGGRPPNPGSVTYWLKQLMAENEGKGAYDLAGKIIQQANDGSYPHQNIVLERVDGNVASEVNIKGVILHVGDEYAAAGIDAMRDDLASRQLRHAPMPQIANSSPINDKKGITEFEENQAAASDD